MKPSYCYNVYSYALFELIYVLSILFLWSRTSASSYSYSQHSHLVAIIVIVAIIHVAEFNFHTDDSLPDS